VIQIYGWIFTLLFNNRCQFLDIGQTPIRIVGGKAPTIDHARPLQCWRDKPLSVSLLIYFAMSINFISGFGARVVTMTAIVLTYLSAV
jgi:hypothetical protein